MSEYTTASELFEVKGYRRNLNKEIPSKVYQKVLELVNALDCEMTIKGIMWFERNEFVSIEFSKIRVVTESTIAGWEFNWFQSFDSGSYLLEFQYHF